MNLPSKRAAQTGLQQARCEILICVLLFPAARKTRAPTSSA